MRQKSIFITGAASGIGRATALLFLKKGWFVGGYDLDEKGLASLQDELQENGTTACLDVTDKSAFDDAMASFSKQTDGHMDMMFNNAGIALGGFFDEIPFDKIMLMLNVNLIGVVNGAYAAISANIADVFKLNTGRIAVGKNADLVLWSADPFELSTKVDVMWINGEQVSTRSRQDALRERYTNQSNMPKAYLK